MKEDRAAHVVYPVSYLFFMRDISLKELLEAGCHFGHRVERWHPKASKYIFQAREGIHIIDLAKTKEGLLAAAEFLRSLGEQGKSVIFVGTKRQAKDVIYQEAKRVGASYLTNRWIGGFITNWEEVKKNIDKILKAREDRAAGAWTKFPKHEQVKLDKDLRKLEIVYGGVVELKAIPDAIVIVDIKREGASILEAVRKSVKTVAIVDTNADGKDVDFVIPANDDAIGSIQCIITYLADSYSEGKEKAAKNAAAADKKQQAAASTPVQTEEKETSVSPKATADKEKDPVKKTEEKPAEKPKKAAKKAPKK